MPRWLNVGLAVVGVVVVGLVLIARGQRLAGGSSYVRAGTVGAVAFIVLGVVVFVGRRYGDPET